MDEPLSNLQKLLWSSTRRWPYAAHDQGEVTAMGNENFSYAKLDDRGFRSGSIPTSGRGPARGSR